VLKTISVFVDLVLLTTSQLQIFANANKPILKKV